MIIDTHAHLQFPEFNSDIEDVLKRAAEKGVGKIINVGCNLDACSRGLTLIDLYDSTGSANGQKGSMETSGVELFATLGLHPYDAEVLTDDLLKNWEEKIKKYGKKIVAIGEIGLDYFKAQVSHEIQQDAFKRQIEFAQKMNLPIVVHNREADEDTLRILRESGLGKGGTGKVVFHCYGSSLDFAREVWKEGFYTSFTGVITYPNAADLREVVAECPNGRWMVETDCPYLAPQGMRGQRNEPSYVKEVLEKVAEVKGLRLGDAEKLQEENAVNFYFICSSVVRGGECGKI